MIPFIIYLIGVLVALGCIAKLLSYNPNLDGDDLFFALFSWVSVAIIIIIMVGRSLKLKNPFYRG
jgi:low affinity Fe/Cu permease